MTEAELKAIEAEIEVSGVFRYQQHCLDLIADLRHARALLARVDGWPGYVACKPGCIRERLDHRCDCGAKELIEEISDAHLGVSPPGGPPSGSSTG